MFKRSLSAPSETDLIFKQLSSTDFLLGLQRFAQYLEDFGEKFDISPSFLHCYKTIIDIFINSDNTEFLRISSYCISLAMEFIPKWPWDERFFHRIITIIESFPSLDIYQNIINILFRLSCYENSFLRGFLGFKVLFRNFFLLRIMEQRKIVEIYSNLSTFSSFHD